MLFFRGGNHVNKGHYWSPATGAWIDGRSETLLPGAPDTVYLRLHPAAMFVLAPAIGLAFVLILPCIAVVAVASAIVTRIARALADSVSTLAYFEWRPNEAYLAGKGKSESKKDNENTNGDAGSH